MHWKMINKQESQSKSSTMTDESPQQPVKLLSKGECEQLFREMLGIGRTYYFENYRPHIKFKYYGQKKDENGEFKKTIPRIPHKVALGLINLLMDRPQPNDPPIEELKKFMKNVPEGMIG